MKMVNSELVPMTDEDIAQRVLDQEVDASKKQSERDRRDRILARTLSLDRNLVFADMMALLRELGVVV